MSGFSSISASWSLMSSVDGIFHHKLITISKTFNFMSHFKDIFLLLPIARNICYLGYIMISFTIHRKLKPIILAQI